MSGLDFRALGNPPEQRPVRDYNFYKLELQWPLIGTMRPELRLLNLHFFNICRHHPTLKFKPHATDDERYVSGIDGVPLSTYMGTSCSAEQTEPPQRAKDIPSRHARNNLPEDKGTFEAKEHSFSTT